MKAHTKPPSMPGLRRNLSARQLSMIAIGGAIGTGLFIASGSLIHTAGPGGAIVAFLLMGIMVYFMMGSLGEMSALLPTSGSFNEYAARFVDPAFGFAMGWNYWFNWSVTIAVELVAATVVMKFWFPHCPSYVWSISFLALIVGLNIFSVRGFGETEYWLSWIKVSTLVIFIIVGALIIFGIIGGHPTGIKNWHIGDAPFHSGWLATLGAIMVAGFSFQGTELVGLTAGESKNPRKNIPKAIGKVFWRILIFYILTTVVISFIIPYTNPNLANSDVKNIMMSPFTIVFHRAGLTVAASLMNAVILVAILSTANAGLYASTRTLWYLSKAGKAPKIFSSVSKHGIPVPALLATAAVGGLAFLTTFFKDGVVYFWLLNASALAGFIAWFGIALTHYRFRKAFMKQGYDLNSLPYRSKSYPFGPILCLIMCLVVIVGQNIIVFTGKTIDWHEVFISYVGLPLFITMWFSYKVIKRSKVIPLEKCSFRGARLSKAKNTALKTKKSELLGKSCP